MKGEPGNSWDKKGEPDTLLQTTGGGRILPLKWERRQISTLINL